MSSFAQRASILAAGAAALAFGAAGPATAQADSSAVLNILVECAKIDDPTARLACYDNNMTRAGATVRSTVPGQVRAQGGGAPLQGQQGPAGFGADDVRAEGPDRFRPPAGQLDEIAARVTAIRAREPGIYMLTLEDGAQWLFAEGVSLSYRLPRAGSLVEIERGSLGSYLMIYDGQGVVPVTRFR